MSDDREIHIHNNSMDSNAHVWRVVSTFLAIGALVSLAWGLAQFGMLELAATGTAAVFSMLVQLLLRNGFIVLPESATTMPASRRARTPSRPSSACSRRSSTAARFSD